MNFLIAINEKNQQVFIAIDKIISLKKVSCMGEKMIEVMAVDELFYLKKIEGVTNDAVLFVGLEDWLNEGKNYD